MVQSDCRAASGLEREGRRHRDLIGGKLLEQHASTSNETPWIQSTRAHGRHLVWSRSGFHQVIDYSPACVRLINPEDLTTEKLVELRVETGQGRGAAGKSISRHSFRLQLINLNSSSSSLMLCSFSRKDKEIPGKQARSCSYYSDVSRGAGETRHHIQRSGLQTDTYTSGLRETNTTELKKEIAFPLFLLSQKMVSLSGEFSGESLISKFEVGKHYKVTQGAAQTAKFPLPLLKSRVQMTALTSQQTFPKGEKSFFQRGISLTRADSQKVEGLGSGKVASERRHQTTEQWFLLQRWRRSHCCTCAAHTCFSITANEEDRLRSLASAASAPSHTAHTYSAAWFGWCSINPRLTRRLTTERSRAAFVGKVKTGSRVRRRFKALQRLLGLHPVPAGCRGSRTLSDTVSCPLACGSVAEFRPGSGDVLHVEKSGLYDCDTLEVLQSL
ncbi:unnamed protein product [Pleuronectes platessa]|uniref:Uncharacterized protein n=1 Tax=Pleuronectes platessa TaxID=8262 RepID=A0A9N7TQC9_PLEPL|nr:unnamed protein product [Pleuronectes platessa]